jgi:uncharacterized protein YdhG (YjbR/CyaY superfamily)
MRKISNNKMKITTFTTIDEYLEGVSDENRNALQHIRDVVKATAPEAEECIAYMMPAFKYKGALVYFAAFEKHCSFFPGGIVEAFKEELKDFKISKGTIQFTPKNHLPDDLIIKIVKFRMEQNEYKEEMQKAKKKKK